MSFQTLNKYKGLRTIWFGQIVSKFGDNLDSIAFTWMIYKLTGSASLMSLLLIVNMIPNILFGSLFGVFADRLKKKPLIVLCQIGRGTLVAFIALLFAIGELEVWHVFLITFLNSTLETLEIPSSTSLFSLMISDKNDVMEITATKDTFINLAGLIGMASAGILISYFGISVAIAIDALTFFASGICVLITKIPLSANEVNSKEELKRNFWNDYKEGLVFIKQNSIVQFILIIAVSLNFMLSPITLLLPIFSDKILHMGSKGYSILGSSFSIGMILGSIIVSKISKRFKLKTLLFSSLVLIGTGLVFFSLSKGIYMAIFSILLTSLSLSVGNTCVWTMVMTKLNQSYIGRVSSILGSLGAISAPLGMGVVGFIVDKIPVEKVLLFIGLWIIFAVLIIFLRKTPLDYEDEIEFEGIR